ncbi:MAG: hypothetical protein ACP5T4_00475 [Candidatus Micrarchaeia archaeon]
MLILSTLLTIPQQRSPASAPSSSASAPTLQQCESSGIVETTAPWYCNQINQAAARIWTKWEPIAVAAAFAAFLVAFIIFVIGVAIKNETVRNFGLGEIYEAVASLIIVVIFLFLSATLFGIIPSMATGNIDPYTTALTYVANTINATAGLEKVLFNSYMVDAFYANTFLAIIVGSEMRYANYLPWAYLIVVYYLLPLDVLAPVLLEALLLLYTEFYAILFFMYASIPIFLIPGIILRAIFPTRSIGGMMMAIAISFYLIMPLLFSIAFYFTNSTALSLLYNSAEEVSKYSAGSGVELNAISPTSPLVLTIQGIEQGMGAYWMSLLFYPSLIIAIVYESIVIIADFIGGFAKTSALLRGV